MSVWSEGPSPAPSVERAAERIERHDGELRCFISTRLDEARAEAPEKRASGGSLAGIPYGLKDEFDTPVLPTTTGSWRHRDRVTPGFSSAPHEAFEAAGAVLLGKTNLSDMGLAPEASSWVGGSTKNPFDRARTSGGSSGGSAAAVAFGLEAFDWGTDIGGSIRLPAAFCGILGLKLSAERWPLRELFPVIPESMRWLLGQGPLAHTTDRLRAVLDAAAPVIEAPGPPAPFTANRIAIYSGHAGDWPSFVGDVGAVLRDALELDVAPTDALAPPSKMQEIFGAMWASHFEDLLDCDPSISLGEGIAAALSATVFRGAFGDRRFHPLTAELLLAIAIGRVFVFRDRDKARARALAVRDTFADLWADGAVVVAPVVAYPPPIIGQTNRNPNLLGYTAPGNLADATGLSIPFGTFDGRLPRAIQLLGPPGSERALLDLGDAIIEARDRVPALRQPRVVL